MNISVTGAGRPFPYAAFFDAFGSRSPATPTSVSPTEVVYSNAAGFTVTLSGTGLSTDSGNLPSAGTITGIVIMQGGVTQATLSDLSWAFTALESALNQVAGGNTAQLSALMGTPAPLSVDLSAATSGLPAGDWFNGILNGSPSRVEIYGSDFGDGISGSRFGDFVGARDGDDTIWFSGGPDTGYGGAGDDLLQGHDGWDQLWGGAGDDTIDGGTGNDVLGGAAGNDVLRGGDGNDSLYAFTGNDSLNAGAGNDELWGGAGDDTAEAGDGDDTVGAGSGNDSVDGAAGNDVLWGGSGNDVMSGGAGADVIWAYTGDDTVRGGDGDDTLGGGVGNDMVDGGGGNDEIYAFDGADTVYGGWGQDTLYAGRDGDVLFGDSGADSLWGSDGEDTLTGGRGNDTLLGGGQGDLYRFTLSDFAGQTGASRDVIEGFQPGVDRIGIYGFAGIDSLADLTLTPVTGGLEIALGPDWSILLSGVAASSDLSAADFEITGEDTVAPEIAAALVRDTGASASDGITTSVAISGRVSDDLDSPSLSATFGNPGTGPLVGLYGDTSRDGMFQLDLARLEEINGGALSDGAHVLSLVSQDFAGNRTVETVSFTLDRSAPQVTGVSLSASSDSGARGDGATAYRIVTLTGQAAPGDAVFLADQPQIATVAGADGRFALSGVAIGEGVNDITLGLRDLAGNEAQTGVSITGLPEGAGSDPVLLWTQIALDTIAANASGDTKAARALAMNAIAIYDVVAAADGLSPFLVDAQASGLFSLDAAVASASHMVLSYAFPALAPQLDVSLGAALAAVADGAAEDAGVALGAEIAAEVIRIRDADGWDDFETYAGGTAPGEWAPTAPFYNVAVTPQYATLETFGIAAPDAFRPDGPPDLDSAEYAAALAEVQDLGAIDSPSRTAAQTEAARFWQDGAGSYTTPGRWTHIAIDVAEAEAASAADSAHMLAMLNIALADSAIAAWDAKYEYGLWRPIDAIHDADLDGNAATVPDPGWNSFLTSPAHPEYVSGHSAFSGAAAAVLTHVFGEDYAFDTFSMGLPGVTRSYDSFAEAAAENGASRIWGGVHYSFSNADGLSLGEDVASAVMESFNATVDRVPPRIVMDTTGPLILQSGASIPGRVIDTLSGVGAVSVVYPSGYEQALALNTDGRFSFETSAFADGTYSFTFVATDLAGNERSHVQTVTIDGTAPAITLSGLPDGVTLDDDARLQGSADGTGSQLVSLRYAIDGGTARTLSRSGDGSFDAALDLGDLAPGTHNLTVTARDAAGNVTTEQRAFTIAAPAAFEVVELLPADGADEIGVTFRPEVTLSRAVNPLTLTNDTFYASDASGNVLPANIVLSADGRTGYMFFDGPVPGSSAITLHLDGDAIRAAADDAALDGDADGTPGGAFASDYTTVSTTPAPGTTLTGRIVGPGPDQQPMTTDDFSAGPDGVTFTADDEFLIPIAGAEVFILGREDIVVTTDAQGYFTLTGIPAGNVKVAVDGRTATNAPDGVFYPEMVMDVTIEPGRANTLMGGMGSTQERLARQDRGEVYLPVISTAILTDVSPDAVTEVGLADGSFAELTEAQRDAIRLTLQPGVAVDETGAPATGAQIGISTVPPELVQDMLPAGLMQHTFDLTIQAPGATTFTTPAELTLPNVFGAAPGTQLNILSFDHTTGRLVIEGTATVSEDGLTVTSDPGTGITKPGWHGLTPPGTETTPEEPPVPPEEPPTWEETVETLNNNLQANQGTAGAAYANQVACIAAAACEAGETWGSGWVKNVFDKIGRDAAAGHNQYSDQNFTRDIPLTLIEFEVGNTTVGVNLGAIGAVYDGSLHFVNELAEGFWENRDRLESDFDGDGTLDHTDFFEQAVGPCFDEVVANGNLAPGAGFFAKIIVPKAATILREGIVVINKGLKLVDRLNPFSDSSSDGPRRAPQEIFPGLVDNPFFIQELNDASDFIVENTVGDLFASGTAVELSITVDNVRLTAEDGVEFFIVSGSRHASINAGSLLVEKAEIQFAGIPEPILIFAQYQGGIGFGQFAIYNEDRDGDFIPDAVESESGLIVGAINVFTDLDRDGLSDLEEVVYRSDLSNPDTDGDGFKDGIEAASGHSILYAQAGQGPIPEAAFYWQFEDVATGVSVRGFSRDFRDFSSVFLASNAVYNFRAFFPDLNLATESQFVSDSSGTQTTFSFGDFITDGLTFDADTDNLPDLAELIIGTSATNSDTDGDGILDGAEIAQGLDPLGDFGSSTGIVNTLSLTGQVNKIVVVDGSGAGSVAFVMTSAGLSVLDLSNARQPLLLTEIGLNGAATDAAFDPATGLGIVIAGGRALQFDVSDPAAPVEIGTLGSQAQAVVMVDGLAVITDDDALVLLDPSSGTRIDTLTLPGAAAIRALVRDGDFLYTLNEVGQIAITELDGELLVPRGRLDTGQFLDEGVTGLFAANGVLYMPASNGFSGGYQTYDVSDPDAPALISEVDDTGLAGNAIALNGSGNALIVGSPGGVGATNAIDLISVSDPQETGELITRFQIDNGPSAVTIAGGVGYVGDLGGNVHVVNYSAFDVNGQPPQIDFATLPEDIAPGTDGLQVLEGSRLSVAAAVTDDVQVRRISLLMNGTEVASDLQFPFDLAVQLPLLAEAAGTTVTLQLRAEDTGGNVGFSPLLTVQLSPDLLPPALSFLTPGEAGTMSQRNPAVTALFSEALDPGSVTPDMVRLVPDDGGAALVATGLSFLREDRSVRFTFDAPPLGEYTLRADFTGVSDVAGNAIAQPAPVEQGIFVETASSIFSERGGGDWSNPQNWEDGTLPDQTDDVLIVLEPGATAALSFEDATVADLRVRGGTLELEFATLETGTVDLADATLHLTGRGGLTGAEVNGGDGSRIDLSGATLDGVTLNVETRTTVSGYYGGYATVENGLTVNNALLVGDEDTGTPGTITFAGPQRVDGSGEIRLSGSGGYYGGTSSLILSGSDYAAVETLTFGPDLTISGSGSIRSYSSSDRIAIEGTLIAEGGDLYVSGLSQDGAALTVRETGRGELFLTDLDQVELIIEAGTAVDLRRDLTDVTLRGGGVAHMTGGGTARDLTIATGTEARLSPGAGTYYGGWNPELTVESGLRIDGTFTLPGDDETAPRLYLSGTQTVAGSGELVLRDTGNSGYFYGYTARIFSGWNSVADVVTFGADLTVRGSGQIAVREEEDSLRFLGDVMAEGGTLVLEGVDQGGEVLNARQGTDGRLVLRGDTDNTVLDISAGSEVELTHDATNLTVRGGGTARLYGTVTISDLTVEAGATVSVDAAAGNSYSGAPNFYLYGGLTLDGTLVISATDDTSASAVLYDGQSVSGTGSIALQETTPVAAGVYSYYGGRASLTLRGADDAVSETITVGAGIDIRGSGRVMLHDRDDHIRILGDIEARDGLLMIEQLDQGGATLSVRESGAGELYLTDGMRDGTLDIGAGSAIEINGPLEQVSVTGGGVALLGAGAALDGVMLAAGTGLRIDTEAHAGIYEGSRSVSVTGGLTLDGHLEVDGSSGGYSHTAGLVFQGGQILQGGGAIRMETVPGGSYYGGYGGSLVFRGADSSIGETLQIGAGITIAGNGFIRNNYDLADRIRLDGTVVADDGSLGLYGLLPVNGTLGATDDGVLDVRSDIVLNDGSRLEIGLGAAGVGRIEVRTELTLGGTLALDVGADFSASLGDTFEFASTAANGATISGGFGAYEGFDLAGNMAFVMETVQSGLRLRVVTDAEAQAAGFLPQTEFAALQEDWL